MSRETSVSAVDRDESEPELSVLSSRPSLTSRSTSVSSFQRAMLRAMPGSLRDRERDLERKAKAKAEQEHQAQERERQRQARAGAGAGAEEEGSWGEDDDGDGDGDEDGDAGGGRIAPAASAAGSKAPSVAGDLGGVPGVLLGGEDAESISQVRPSRTRTRRARREDEARGARSASASALRRTTADLDAVLLVGARAYACLGFVRVCDV